MKKRSDLQWLRALAIFAVVGFHLEPKRIPFGYLGVDVFFVLSGYLMTTILSQDVPILKFYSNRVKRIFPTFALVIAAVMGISFFVLLPSDYAFLKTEAIWSVFFVNNLYPIFHQEQYFEMLSEFRFLVHTWSLGVEIQFYLIAPFLLRFLLSRKRQIPWVAEVSILSFFAQLLCKTENVAFGLVFCRIWQFLAGTLAFYLTPIFRSYVPSKTQGYSKNIIFVALGIICFFPLHVNPKLIIQTLATLFASIFIALETEHFMTSRFYIESFFVYIGDASYIIYLVHWPTIIYFRYFNIFYGNAILLLIISAISIFLYQCFELPLMKRSLAQIYSVLLILYAIILCLYIVKNTTSMPSVIVQNEKEAESCKKLYYPCEDDAIMNQLYQIKTLYDWPIKYCIYKINPLHNKTIMIAGNSFSFWQNRGLIEAIKEAKTQFSKIYFTTISGCNLIVGKFNEKYICKNFYEIFYNVLNITKPDVIIISARIDMFIPYDTADFGETDEYLIEFKQNNLRVSEFTQRLIILEPNPIFIKQFFNKTIFNPLKVAQTLKIGGSVLESNITTQEFHQIHDPSWNRVKKAVENSPNCILVPTEHLFCQDGICPMVDPKTQLSIYCDDTHITPEKSLSLKPSLIEAIDQENPLFNKKNLI